MRLLFLIMIILLPLRGWVSDAMATGMVTALVEQQTAARVVATHADEAGVQAHQDTETVVADRAQIAADCAVHLSGGSGHAVDTHCNSCSVCQACHTIVLAPEATDGSTDFNPRTLPRAVVAQFASAEAALGQKPPIS